MSSSFKCIPQTIITYLHSSMSVFFFPLLSGEFYVLASQMQLDDLRNWNGIFRKYLTSTLTNFQMIFNGGNRCCCISARFFVQIFLFVRSRARFLAMALVLLSSHRIRCQQKKNIHLFFHYIELRPHCHHIVVMLCHSWCAPFSVSTEFFRAGFWSIQQASFGTGPSLSSTLFILSIIA